jgi:hypothetical protein
VEGAVAEVVEATFCISKKSTGGSAHAVAIGPFDDMGCSRKGSSANGVVLGSGPEAEDDEIGLLELPPDGVADVEGGRPENRRDGTVWRV